jgi:ribosomal protein L11 methyltransferase
MVETVEPSMSDREIDGTGIWIELSVEAHNECVEPVSELLSRYAYGQGVAVYEKYRQDPDGDNLHTDPERPATVVAYLPDDGEAQDTIRRIEEGLWHLRQIGEVGQLVRTQRPEEDWANSWKDYFHPLRIGNRFVIRPTWREFEPKAGDVVIDLDPGMAFGTGYHPTTELCLVWLEELDVTGKRILDVGAGSGILSIAAVKLGASSVDAVEIDDVAGRALAENLNTNGVRDVVSVSIGDFGATSSGDERYDLVIANIISSILIKLAKPLSRSVEKDGRLLLSGVIDRHAAEVRATFESLNLTVLEERKQGDWIALLLEPNG